MQIYSLFKRKKGKTEYFYVQFKTDGKFGTAQSVEAIRKRIGIEDNHHITKKPEAEYIVQKAIAAGYTGANRLDDQLFSDYIKEFWTYDSSSWIIKENKKNPDVIRIGRDYAANMLGCVNNHIIPNLPKGLKCSQVTQRVIERVQDAILRDNSVNVWISSLKALSRPIKELRHKRILLNDPLFDLDHYTESQKSTVGVLTEKETDNLIRQMYYDMFTPFEITYYKKEKGGQRLCICKPALGSDEEYQQELAGAVFVQTTQVKLDPRIYYATALSCDTGLRKGEILGLHANDIRFPNATDAGEDQALIDVRQAFARRQGFKTPKSKRERTVPVSRWLAQELVEFAASNPHGSDLIFYSDTMPDHPVDLKFINKWYNRELQRIGINEKERTERHLVFHSLRHYANTEYRTRVGDEKTQRVLGHTSTRMTDRYDAGSDRRILQIGQEAGNLINNPRAAEKEA